MNHPSTSLKMTACLGMAWLIQRATSFQHAIRGIFLVVRTQPNAWIHLIATVAVIGAGLCLSLAHWEWAALAFAIGLVWTAEALNTAIEFLADEVTREKRVGIGNAKDVGAGAVLLASTTSAVIGLIVFVPHVLTLTER